MARAVALYIPSFKRGKKWIQQDWFLQFKRIYGTRATRFSPVNWQEKIRMLIRQEVVRYETYQMWACDCELRLEKYHFRHDTECNKCGYKPRMIERHKTEHAVRVNTPVPKTPQAPLKICPVHNRPFDRTEQVIVAGVPCKVPKCPDCKK